MNITKSNVVEHLGSPYRERVFVGIPERALTFEEAAELCAELNYAMQEMDQMRRA